MGVQPRPLRYRGHLNRRGRKARVRRLGRMVAYLEWVTGGPRIYDTCFGSMPMNGPWVLDPNMGLPWHRPPRRQTNIERRVLASAGGAR